MNVIFHKVAWFILVGLIFSACKKDDSPSDPVKSSDKTITSFKLKSAQGGSFEGAGTIDEAKKAIVFDLDLPGGLPEVFFSDSFPE